MDQSGTDPGTTDQLSEDLALAPPANVQVTVNSTTGETLTWDAVPTATKYIIYRGLSSGTETTFTSWPATSTTFYYNHLSPNTNYCWQVGDVAPDGSVSARSSEVCASTGSAPPVPVPMNVTATATSSSRIVVTWSAVAGATAYNVDMAQAPGTPVFRASVNGSTLSWTATGLTPSTTYNFDVRAVTANGTSDPSQIVSATTFALGLELYYRVDESSGTTTADLSGFGRTGTLSGGARFSVDKPNVLNDKTTLDFPAGSTAAVSTANQSAFNFGSPYSISLWVKTPVGGTVHIMGMRNSGCGTVGWELAEDATSLYFASATARQNFGQTLPAGQWAHVAITNDGTTQRLYINGVQTASGAFGVGNHALNPLQLGAVGGCTTAEVLVDEVQVYSRVLTAQEVANMGTLPPAPTNLTVTVNSATSETLNWMSSVASPTKYLIYKGTAAGNETFFTSSPGTTTTFTYGHLTPNTQYSWQVAVVANNLYSNKSNEVIATTNAPLPAPTGVTATAASSTRVNVSWTAVTGATRYYVGESISGGAFADIGSSTTTTFSAANLTTKTMYCYQVRAIDSGNTSSAYSSPPVCVTTP